MQSYEELSRTPEAEQITWSFQPPPQDRLPVVGDPSCLKQVIQQVLDNAMKFNVPPGHITIEGHYEEGQAVLAITDTGIGLTTRSNRSSVSSFSSNTARRNTRWTRPGISHRQRVDGFTSWTPPGIERRSESRQYIYSCLAVTVDWGNSGLKFCLKQNKKTSYLWVRPNQGHA